uniref:NADH dehydrogenase subunit 4L n=1 Tax=Paraponera clavata TaxID=55425 RepID=UPI002A83193A|nr:NADH dehydrogenase subunit 4L [Paraponera clavata]WNO15833.1 NADH dehydrogenase subunit 4L [Paraponera clavata]
MYLDYYLWIYLVFLWLMLLMLMYKFMLIVVMMIEFVVLSITVFMFNFMYLLELEFYVIYYLVFSVCESCLGLSLLVLIVRYYGNDLYYSFNLTKF